MLHVRAVRGCRDRSRGWECAEDFEDVLLGQLTSVDVYID